MACEMMKRIACLPASFLLHGISLRAESSACGKCRQSGLVRSCDGHDEVACLRSILLKEVIKTAATVQCDAAGVRIDSREAR